MNIIVTQRNTDGSAHSAQSADGRYTWFTGQDGYIHDTQAGRSIYQMAYIKTEGFGSDPLPADVEADARAFWAALRADESTAAAAAQARSIAEIDAMPKVSHAEFARRRELERRHDEIHNEGGEGYNPYAR